MEDLLALAELDAILQHIFADSEGVIGYLFIIDEHTALLHKTASLTIGAGQLAGNHQIQNADLAVCQLISSDLGGGHIGIVTAAHEQSLCSSLRRSCLFLTMDKLGQLEGQDLLCNVQLRILLEP